MRKSPTPEEIDSVDGHLRVNRPKTTTTSEVIESRFPTTGSSSFTSSSQSKTTESTEHGREDHFTPLPTGSATDPLKTAGPKGSTPSERGVTATISILPKTGDKEIPTSPDQSSTEAGVTVDQERAREPTEKVTIALGSTGTTSPSTLDAAHPSASTSGSLPQTSSPGTPAGASSKSPRAKIDRVSGRIKVEKGLHGGASSPTAAGTTTLATKRPDSALDRMTSPTGHISTDLFERTGTGEGGLPTKSPGLVTEAQEKTKESIGEGRQTSSTPTSASDGAHVTGGVTSTTDIHGHVTSETPSEVTRPRDGVDVTDVTLTPDAERTLEPGSSEVTKSDDKVSVTFESTPTHGDRTLTSEPTGAEVTSESTSAGSQPSVTTAIPTATERGEGLKVTSDISLPTAQQSSTTVPSSETNEPNDNLKVTGEGPTVTDPHSFATTASTSKVTGKGDEVKPTASPVSPEANRVETSSSPFDTTEAGGEGRVTVGSSLPSVQKTSPTVTITQTDGLGNKVDATSKSTPPDVEKSVTPSLVSSVTEPDESDLKASTTTTLDVHSSSAPTSKASEASEGVNATASATTPQTQRPSTSTDSQSEATSIPDGVDVTSGATTPKGHQQTTVSSSKATGSKGGTSSTSALSRTPAARTPQPQLTTPGNEELVTSKLTTPEVQQTDGPESSSESAVQFTGPGDGVGTTLQPQVTRPGDEGIVTSKPTIPVVQHTDRPESSSESAVQFTGAGDRVKTTSQPQVTRPGDEGIVTSKPTIPNVQRTDSPESSSEPPVQFTGPGDQVETTLGSTVMGQQSFTPKSSTETSADSKGTGKGGVTSRPTVPHQHTGTPVVPSETSSGFTRPQGEAEVTARPTPEVPEPDTTGSPSEAPVQFTGPADEIGAPSGPSSTLSIQGISAGVSGPGKGNVTPGPTAPHQHTGTPVVPSATSSGFTKPEDETDITTSPTPNVLQPDPTGSPAEASVTGSGQKVRTTSSPSPSSHVTRPDDEDEVTPKVNLPDDQHSSSKPPPSDSTTIKSSSKVTQPDEKGDESSIRMMPTIQQALTSTVSSKVSTEPSGPQEKAEVTSRPTPNIQHSSTPAPLSSGSTGATDSHGEIDTISSSTQPAISSSSSGGTDRVTAEPITSVSPSEPSIKTSKPGQSTEETPRQTAGPLVVIDGEMNPDHVLPEGIPGSELAPNSSTTGSPSGTPEGHKITLTPETQDISTKSTESPSKPKDGVSSTTKQDLTKAGKADAPGPKSKSGVGTTTPPIIPDLQSSSPETSPAPSSKVTELPEGSVSLTPRQDLTEGKKTDAPGPIPKLGGGVSTTTSPIIPDLHSTFPESSPAPSSKVTELPEGSVSLAPRSNLTEGGETGASGSTSKSDKQRTSTPSLSSEMSSAFTRPQEEIGVTSRPTPKVREPATTESSSEPPVQFAGPGQKVEVTPSPTPSHSTKPNEEDNATSEPNKSDGKQSATTPPHSDTTRPKSSLKMTQPIEKETETTKLVRPTIQQTVSSVVPSEDSTEPSGPRKEAEVTSEPTENVQSSSTSNPSPTVSAGITKSHGGVGTISSSVSPATSVTSSEFTGPSGTIHVTAKSFTPVSASEASVRTSKSGQPSEVSPKQTAGPLVVIDAEMNPDHVLPEGIPGSELAPKTSTTGSPSGTHEGHKITLTPDTQDIHIQSSTTSTESPSKPKDGVSLTPKPDLTKAGKTNAPEPKSKSDGVVSAATSSIIPDLQSSSPKPSPAPSSRVTEQQEVFEFTPNPDAQNTQKPPGSTSGPGVTVSVTPKSHVEENEKLDSLGPADVTPTPNVPSRQPSSPEPTTGEQSKATGPHGTFTSGPDSQNTQKSSAPGPPFRPGDRVGVTPKLHVEENEKSVPPGSVSGTSRPNVPGRQPSSPKPIPEQPDRATEHVTLSPSPDAQNTQKSPAPGLPSGAGARVGVTPRTRVGENEKPNSAVSGTPLPNIPGRQPSSPEPNPEQPNRATEPHGTFSSSPDAQNTQTSPALEPSSIPNDRVGVTPRPGVGENGKPDFSGTVSATPSPNVPGRQPLSPEPTPDQPSRATGPHGTFTSSPDAQNTQKSPAPGLPTGPGDRVSVTPRPQVGENEKPDFSGTANAASSTNVPGRQPSSPEPTTGEQSKATGPHGTFTVGPDARNTHKSPALESPTGPGERVSVTPRPVGENEKPDTSGPVSRTPRPNIPGRQPSSPEPIHEQPDRATGPHGTFTSSPDAQNNEKPPAPGLPPGAEDTVGVTPRPHVGENEKPDSPGSVSGTPQPNIPGRQPSSTEPTPDQPSRATGPRGTFTLIPDVRTTRQPLTSGFPSGPDHRASTTSKSGIETDGPGSPRSSSTTSQTHNPDRHLSSRPTNRVTGSIEHTTRPETPATRKPTIPGLPSRPNEGATPTREPNLSSTEKPEKPEQTHELGGRVSVTPRPDVPDRLPSSPERSSTSSSTSESPSQGTTTGSKLAPTPRPNDGGIHGPEIPGSPNGANEKASTTSKPNVPNAQQPGTSTTPAGPPTTSTEQTEGFLVNRTQTTGPMIKIDGEMNPEQTAPDSVTPPNRKGFSTSSTIRVVDGRVPTPTREQDRQNFTTTLPEILSTTPPTFSSNGATVVNEKTSSTFEVGPTNATISSSSSPTASSPPSFTLHTTVPVVSSTAPSRPVTDAPTSTTAPSKPDFIEPDILIDSELHSTTEDDLKVVVESFETTSPPPNEGQVTNKRCSSTDRSMCHELAICEVATGSCRCKDGFTGDGYANCT
ncbi:RNA polymerase Rpb1 repeat protein [Teladorsagia circumcincta]|uniref:RNA polymerase Rpb1 repeat protein n=1 Tax=Teladorsagia circumcincta TaxID=45464 RepID=A0A2G9V140_TELCI|nr:RNA polymerase Rpb1 repeat protein [Teladorsagia circumcincta]